MNHFSWRSLASSESSSSASGSGWHLIRSARPVLLPVRFPNRCADDIPRDSRPHTGQPIHQNELLASAGELLRRHKPASAWQALQHMLSHSQSQADGLPMIRHNQWLMMSVCALAIDDIATAQQYAREALEISSHQHAAESELFRDPHGDWLTVVAAIEMSLGDFETANGLLQSAHDSHRAVGDLEQMSVDLMLAADCYLMIGDQPAAIRELRRADEVLTEECNVDRHVALPRLLKNLHYRQGLCSQQPVSVIHN